MTQLALQHYLPLASDLAVGCMGLGGSWDESALQPVHIEQARRLIEAGLEQGFTLFDHADIYTFGRAEQAFGEVLKQSPTLRQKMIIQSKCGIRFADDSGPKRYDFSSRWVTYSVEQSLQRLNTDYLDVLILHRPDPLMERCELADALHKLVNAGKVRYLGVSNMHWQQIAFLQEVLELPIIVNQIELSLQHLDWLDEGVTAGDRSGRQVNFTAGTLEYCHRHGIQLQSWGSLCQGKFSGRNVEQEPIAIQRTAAAVTELSQHYDVPPEAIVLAWLRRHPAGIQPVIGSTNPGRIRACRYALDITLSREHWYQLYVLARGQDLP